MYLSTLLVDVGDNPDRPRPGRLWLRNHYRVHQRLCMGFPSAVRKSNDPHFLQPYKPDDFGESHVHVERADENGFLFRVDPGVSGSVILVQSAKCPDWDYAFHNAGYLLSATPETRQFDAALTVNQQARFRLVANPTRKIDTKSGPDGERRKGKRVPVPVDQFATWLTNRAEAAGFSFDGQELSIQPGYIHFNKNAKEKGNLRSARFDGVLTVTDADRFKQAIIAGIGPEKALGFGLLSVAPMNGASP